MATAPRSRRRIGSYVAIVVAVCSIGGIGLAALVLGGERALDDLQEQLAGSASTYRDVRHLETLIGQWLISVDLVSAHATYLWEGAADQADAISALMSELAEADPLQPHMARLDEMRAWVARVHAGTRSLALLSADAPAAERIQLLSEIDDVSARLVSSFEDLMETLDRERIQLAGMVERDRRRAHALAGAGAVFYLLAVGIAWWWVVRTIVRPLQNLTRLGQRAEPLGSEPREILELDHSLRTYASSLEQEKRALAAAERSSRDSAARVAAIMEAAPSGILVVDSDGAIRSHNPALERMLGVSSKAIHGEALGSLFRDAAADGPVSFVPGKRRVEGMRAGGSTFPADLAVAGFALDGCPAYAVIVHDRTELGQLEKELQESLRLKAVGQLAAGLAHEINTPIQYVGDCLHFLRDAFADLLDLVQAHGTLARAAWKRRPDLLAELESHERDADLSFLTKEIPEACDRTLQSLEGVAQLVRATRDLAHTGDQPSSGVDLNRVVETAVAISQGTCKGVADVQMECVPLPLVACEFHDLVRVIVNLISNAADAISLGAAQPGAPGRIRIVTRSDSGRVFVEVIDNGCGIPEDMRDRIFEPFFTTKGVGQGSGQGLALARAAIVEQYHGELTCSSEVDRGSRFMISMPALHPAGGDFTSGRD